MSVRDFRRDELAAMLDRLGFDGALLSVAGDGAVDRRIDALHKLDTALSAARAWAAGRAEREARTAKARKQRRASTPLSASEDNRTFKKRLEDLIEDKATPDAEREKARHILRTSSPERLAKTRKG